MSSTPETVRSAHVLFDVLIERLRCDFRRIFPHLQPIEDKSFFFKRNPDGTSGKAWIKEELIVDGHRVIRKTTLLIENNRIISRLEELRRDKNGPINTSFDVSTDPVLVESKVYVPRRSE